MPEKYDVIIIGAGPAGLTAAIYAARYKLNVVVISKDIGGTAVSAYKICNYPSYKNISGVELMQKILEQVKELGVGIINEEVLKIEKKDKEFLLKTKKNNYESKKIIYAGGTLRSKLGAKNEDKFIGKGVSYCATCDAALFKNKKVIVVGGGNAALSSALLLSEYAKEVTIVYRKEEFKNAEPSWVELVKKNKKIKCECNEEIAEIFGKEFVESVKLKSGKILNTDGVFVEIGGIPHTYILSFLNIKKNNKGYVIVDKAQKTNVKGFYAAGDITDNYLKQIVTAAGEGATAALGVYREISGER